MFLQLAHTKLDIFQISKSLTLECYRIPKLLPPEEFYEIARGSVIEIDAALDIGLDLKYLTKEILRTLGDQIVNIFKQLTGTIGGSNKL